MNKQTQQIIRWPALYKKIGVTRQTIIRWEKDGKFPKHIQLGKNSTGWLLSQVEEWISSKTNFHE